MIDLTGNTMKAGFFVRKSTFHSSHFPPLRRDSFVEQRPNGLTKVIRILDSSLYLYQWPDI